MPRRGRGLDRPLLPLTDSPLEGGATSWWTSASYQQSTSLFSAAAFHSVVDALLENPNLTSSHLFRADIIFDSTGILKTNKEKEISCSIESLDKQSQCQNEQSEVNADKALRPLSLPGFEPRRTILRKLIPRNPQRDQPLLQTCQIYTQSGLGNQGKVDEKFSSKWECERQFSQLSVDEKASDQMLYRESIARDSQHLVVYQPHVDPHTGNDMPWYHPSFKYLAFLYSCRSQSDSEERTKSQGDLSIHFQFFPAHNSVDVSSPMTDRAHRTVLSLLSTFTRMFRATTLDPESTDSTTEARPFRRSRHTKDNIVPEHLVQNTYSRLKALYASDLITHWVEKTDPLKHVFEDLAIASFLIELWRKMFGGDLSAFAGFVDIACGNGVLVYVLIMEGFRGWGFDARVRRTWSTFPDSITAHLYEKACIPRPFLEVLRKEEIPFPEGLSIHDGTFEEGTFIISNHADELTAWTPLLAAFSCPESPLPWLAIPCCSHALSGAAHRYPPSSHHFRPSGHADAVREDITGPVDPEDQSRACIDSVQSRTTNSTYASLVSQVVRLAIRVDPLQDVQQTLMRIPSTRNIGVVSGQERMLQAHRVKVDDRNCQTKMLNLKRRGMISSVGRLGLIYEIVEEECSRSNGLLGAARVWMEGLRRAKGSSGRNIKPH